MATSLEAFKSFKTVGVVVFADTKKDKASLPKGVMEVRAKGGNTIPMVFVTTADGEKGIDAVPYSALKADMREVVRELRKSLKDVDVLGGDDSEDDADASKDKEEERAPEFKQWENSAGKKIKAAVREIQGGRVHFLLPSGKSVWYDITKLSESSQLRLADTE
ncbi:MAG: hypothetical protein P8P36_01305 [Akkermansiaceae bacterium]|nr:hypothetical protein [Akkermansiaceae bacterium]